MADVQVVLTLDDEMQAAIRLARDEVAPTVGDGVLLDLVKQWALEGIKLNVYNKVNAVVDRDAEDAAELRKAPVLQAIDLAFPTP